MTDGRRSRGHRRAAQNAESSSEYSSPHEHNPPSAHSPQPHPSYSAIPAYQSDEQHNQNSRSPRLPSYSHGPDPDETSDGSNAPEHYDITPMRPASSLKANRGKKGLTHAELALADRHNGDPVSSAARDDETEDEDDDTIDHAHNGASHIQQQLDETEDEDEDDNNHADDDDDAEDYAAALRRAHVRAASERKRSIWGQCNPIVAEAAKMLELRSAEPYNLGYAKLMGAGKVIVDYLIRKQSIIIGRSTTMADCIIKGESRLISRRHAKLYWDEDRKEWIIICLSNKNGLLVNGIPVVPGSVQMPIKSRDLIEVGDAPFYFLAATAPLIRVNNIDALEKEILSVRAQEERERAASEEERQRNEARYGRLRQGRFLHPSKKFKEKLDQRKALESRRMKRGLDPSERPSSSRKRAHSASEDGTGHSWKKRRRSGSKGRAFREGRNDGDFQSDGHSGDEADNDPDMTEDEEPTPSTKPGRDDENLLSYGQSRRRADKEGAHGADGRHGGLSHDDDSKFREEWTKKEKTDFGRALFAVGVDPIFDKDGTLDHYDWSRFRKIAELSRKSDDMLEDYYIRVMTDVNALLEEEEREKRTKGPRTKHKAGCDCIVCENTRKSRKKKQEERDITFADDRDVGDSDGGDDNEVKSTAKAKDKLVGLVTAQKLRVRLSIHEAARKVNSYAGDVVFERLSKQKDDHVKDFPQWWRPGYHDRSLMHGTAIHGVGQWLDIWHDPKEKPFRKVRERYGESLEWPTNQAAMKRVRELASLINSELRREAKRAAQSDRGSYWRERKSSKPPLYGSGKLGSGPRRKKMSRKREMLDDDMSRYELKASAGGDTTEDESASDGETPKRQDVSQVETEDEEEVVEVEVEEMEEEEDDQATEDDEDNVKPIQGIAAKEPAVPGSRSQHQAVSSTSSDEDEYNRVRYETQSDTD